jgi:ABC-type polysaccharide/polyol phosphate transport system ATPase subunit
MATATMQQGQERQQVEKAIESQSAQEWQRTLQQIEQLASGGQLGHHYQYAAKAVRDSSSQVPESVIAAITGMPPSTKSALFELVTGVVRLAEQHGPQQAEQVTSFLCSTFQQAARQATESR